MSEIHKTHFTVPEISWKKTVSVLIVGYGSAGRRHEEIVKSVAPWAKISTVDIDGNADYDLMSDALHGKSWDIIVISTPPQYHVGQTRMALDNGAWVMCEKPLCSIGQMSEARDLVNHPLTSRVMVSYNYRFSDDFKSLRGLGTDAPIAKRWWRLYCSQHRSRLPFGLLLDHVSHDIDILRHVSNQELLIKRANYYSKDSVEKWVVNGIMFNGHNFEILETVDKERDVKRQAILTTPDGWTHINGGNAMHIAMWDKFLQNIQANKPQWPGIEDAIKTQKALEDIHGYANSK